MSATVGFFAVKYFPDTKEYPFQQIEAYKRKKSQVEDLRPKPLELQDGSFVLYLWAEDSNAAILRANKRFSECLKFPVEV